MILLILLVNSASCYFAITPTTKSTTTSITQRTRRPKNCPIGYATGINELGHVDVSNKRKCYLKVDTADVVSCNNVYGAVEMVIKINKDFYDARAGMQNQTPIGFELDGDNYLAVVEPTRNKLHLSANREDVEFHHTLIIDADKSSHSYGKLEILFSPIYVIEFVCKYSLDMQVVSTSTKVKGVDMHDTRERRGQLSYRMEFRGRKTIKMGDKRHFAIIPTTPGLVYASVIGCRVSSNDGKVYKLTEMEQDSSTESIKHVCTDSITSFTKSDKTKWPSTDELHFSFTAFRWSANPDERTETQTIECDVRLDYEPPAFINRPCVIQGDEI